MGFNTAMKKKYYNITDVIKFFARQSLSIDVKDIHSCTRERIIHPLIYIDSAPVYACESQGEERIAIGFCFLSAYLDAGDEIKAIFATIVRKSSAKLQPWLIKNQLTGCEIYSWSIEPATWHNNKNISYLLHHSFSFSHCIDNM